LNKIDKESSRFFGILNQLGATFAPIRSDASASIRIKFSVREITAQWQHQRKKLRQRLQNQLKKPLPARKMATVLSQVPLCTKNPEHFCFDAFKGNQEAIIKTLLAGNDTFVIKPAGGKSLCYQLPALMSEGWHYCEPADCSDEKPGGLFEALAKR
jgi:hypothetical protein